MGTDEGHIEGDMGWDLGFDGGPGFSGRRSALMLVRPLAARAANHTRPYLTTRLDLSRASLSWSLNVGPGTLLSCHEEPEARACPIPMKLSLQRTALLGPACLHSPSSSALSNRCRNTCNDSTEFEPCLRRSRQGSHAAVNDCGLKAYRRLARYHIAG